eukprot:6210771-Pleurochrysis_carterae.AAC.1
MSSLAFWWAQPLMHECLTLRLSEHELVTWSAASRICDVREKTRCGSTTAPATLWHRCAAQSPPTALAPRRHQHARHATPARLR